MNKKNILIITAVIILVIAAIWLFVSLKNSGSNIQSSPNTNSSANQASTATGNVSVSSSNPSNFTSSDQASQNASVTSQNDTPNPHLPNLVIVNPYDQTQSKQEFQKFLTAPAPTNQLTQIVDTRNKILPLNQFAAAMDIKINSTLNSFLDPYDYQLVRCADIPGSAGLMLNLGLFPNKLHLYTDAQKMMRNWESTLLEDTYPVIFPNAGFTTKSASNQILVFKDGQYRYAQVKLPNGTIGSINYSLIFDSITITNSPQCLAEVSAKVETLEP